MTYEIVMGLEVHVELDVKSKIFCSCSTAFGAVPNSQVCPVCLGLPGTLPSLNKEVVNKTVKAGLVLGCNVANRTVFDRKNYFYPDLPKAYQISQLYAPICTNGRLEIETPEGPYTIGIHELHMEEDAGKLIHQPDATLIDYNRCGVPLIEIVTEPDFRTADQVQAFLERLREDLSYQEISDCKMQEGSMRVDVNLSVRPEGSTLLGTRTEMKNLSSFRSIRRAIAAESARQIALLESGGTVVQETRRFDEASGQTFSMRTKENAQDYRYFPDPDLPPVKIDDRWIARIRRTITESPSAKRARYQKDLGIPKETADSLTYYKETAALFENTALRLEEDAYRTCCGIHPTGDAALGRIRIAATLIAGDVLRLLRETATPAETLTLSPASLAWLSSLLEGDRITRASARDALEAFFAEGTLPEDYIRSHNLLIEKNDALLSEIISKVLEEQAASAEEYRNGKEKVLGFLVGQVMKQLNGKASPKDVNRLLLEHLKN
ncbi:MAG: Asp-tRNA(Asn)/Glu-tRNA(Gln) amidotransferase subunit GatB [Clostridiales bacterium]|nr:Asp-tRNA(Asn)/Glu-tRNA(Gln) amidotransferase subunit GatB [Clostridiales bacterium]